MANASGVAAMFAVGVCHVSLLNAAAQRCMIPSIAYLWEFSSDGPTQVRCAKNDSHALLSS
uniref:Secreted protein n=1 Tax=Oryza rufipogon TaxID=4529 RepID=A0A0E0QX77_ORYRU